MVKTSNYRMFFCKKDHMFCHFVEIRLARAGATAAQTGMAARKSPPDKGFVRGACSAPWAGRIFYVRSFCLACCLPCLADSRAVSVRAWRVLLTSVRDLLRASSVARSMASEKS